MRRFSQRLLCPSSTPDPATQRFTHSPITVIPQSAKLDSDIATAKTAKHEADQAVAQADEALRLVKESARAVRLSFY